MNKKEELLELFPKQGEWLLYKSNDAIPYYPSDLALTMGNEYQVLNVRLVSCADAVEIKDDNGFKHYVALHHFSFISQHEWYDRGNK